METQYKERVDCDVTTWERGLIWVCGLYAVSTLIARTQRPFSNFPPPFLRVLLAPAVIPSNFHHQPPFSIYIPLFFHLLFNPNNWYSWIISIYISLCFLGFVSRFYFVSQKRWLAWFLVPEENCRDIIIWVFVKLWGGCCFVSFILFLLFF